MFNSRVDIKESKTISDIRRKNLIVLSLKLLHDFWFDDNQNKKLLYYNKFVESVLDIG